MKQKVGRAKALPTHTVFMHFNLQAAGNGEVFLSFISSDFRRAAHLDTSSKGEQSLMEVCPHISMPVQRETIFLPHSSFGGSRKLPIARLTAPSRPKSFLCDGHSSLMDYHGLVSALGVRAAALGCQWEFYHLWKWDLGTRCGTVTRGLCLIPAEEPRH